MIRQITASAFIKSRPPGEPIRDVDRLLQLLLRSADFITLMSAAEEEEEEEEL